MEAHSIQNTNSEIEVQPEKLRGGMMSPQDIEKLVIAGRDNQESVPREGSLKVAFPTSEAHFAASAS